MGKSQKLQVQLRHPRAPRRGRLGAVVRNTPAIVKI
jgi:hypothetical protein